MKTSTETMTKLMDLASSLKQQYGMRVKIGFDTLDYDTSFEMCDELGRLISTVWASNCETPQQMIKEINQEVHQWKMDVEWELNERSVEYGI